MDGSLPRARVCIVGALRVERDGRVVHSVQLGSRKARLVLGLLASDARRIRPATELCDVLWPDGAPTSADATIASLVSRLRHTLGDEVIAGGRAGYRLDPAALVDLDEAATFITEAERRLAAGQPGLAVSASAAALALLPGTALADLGDSDWVSAARSRHESLLRRARSAAAHAALAVGTPARARELAQDAFAADPFDEDAARTLMTALATTGETAAALQVYARLRLRLVDELGTDPAEATSELHTELLRGRVVPERRSRITPSDSRDLLVGREQELARLREIWSDTANGRGALVVISGEPGVGKTRLADEFAGLVRATGGAVLSARCYEAEQALFLQPFVEAITGYVAHREPSEVLDAVGTHLDTLARLVPAIGALTKTAPHTVRPNVEVERRRAIEAVTSFLTTVARDRPFVLVLDDLHHAGASSVELVHFLRTVLRTTPMVVVATVRSDEGAHVLDALAEVAVRIEPGALPASAVRELAAAAGQRHRADEIVERTRGHALFVVEVLRDRDVATVPRTLQAAVLTRLSRTGGTAEAVLRAGAVLGAAFDPTQAAVLAGLPVPEALSGCERALRAGLLRTAGRSYEFANDLVREALYATTPVPTRLAQHTRAMDLLTTSPEQLATHARAVEDWPRAARAWLVAAEDALKAFAADDAVSLAGRALDAAEQARDLELRGRALVLRGRARDVCRAYAGAWQDFTAAVETADAVGDRRLEMTVLREIAGDVPVALGHPPAAAEAPLLRCLHLAEELGARTTETDVLGRLGILAITRLDFVGALAYSERAMRTARSAADPRALELAFDVRKSCWAYLGEVGRLEPVLAELEPRNRHSGDFALLQWTLFESSFVPLARGDHQGALSRVDAALDACRSSGFTAFEPFFLAHAAWVHRLSGDIATALRLGAVAVTAAREHRHGWWLSTAAAVHAGSLLATGAREQAASVLTEIRPIVDVPGAQAYLARCLAPLAEATRSREILVEADAVLRSVRAPDGSAWLSGADAYLSVARAWMEQREPERAHAVLHAFLPAARRVAWHDLVLAAELALR